MRSIVLAFIMSFSLSSYASPSLNEEEQLIENLDIINELVSQEALSEEDKIKLREMILRIMYPERINWDE